MTRPGFREAADGSRARRAGAWERWPCSALWLAPLLCAGCQALSTADELRIQQDVGATCRKAVECASGYCVDGVCCDVSCQGECSACDLPTSPGRCAYVPAGADPDDECAAALSCNGSGQCHASAVSAVSVRRPGNDWLGGLAVDASGEVALTGTCYDEAGSSGEQACFTELDAQGNLNWQGLAGAPARQWGRAVTRDRYDGAAVVAGTFEGQLDLGAPPFGAPGQPAVPAGCLAPGGEYPRCTYVVRLKANGAYDWGRAFGASLGNFAAFDATDSIEHHVDEDRGVVVAGFVAGTVGFDSAGDITARGDKDVLVGRFDSEGALQWIDHYGDESEQGAMAVAVDPSLGARHLVVAGVYQGSVDFGGGALVGAAENNVFVAKLDLDGGHQWSRGFAATGGVHVSGVGVDASGNIALVGGFDGSLDLGGETLLEGAQALFAAQLTSEGDLSWARAYTGTGYLYAYAASVEPATGDLCIVGDFGNAVDFGGGVLSAQGSDGFVVCLDASGSHLWSMAVGGPQNEYLRGIAFGPDRSVVVGGHFMGTFQLGETLLDSGSDIDFFVAQLSTQ